MPGPSKKAQRLIQSYGAARAADHVKGGGDPQDTPEIEERLRQSALKLRAYVAGLEEHKVLLRELRERMRPDSEAAPWVIAELDRLLAL